MPTKKEFGILTYIIGVLIALKIQPKFTLSKDCTVTML